MMKSLDCAWITGILFSSLVAVSGQLTREVNSTLNLSEVVGEPNPSIDGTLIGDEGEYGEALAVQDNSTGFGDNSDTNRAMASGSELDAAYGVMGNGSLYLLFPGNLENAPDPFHKLFVFIDSVEGGQNRLLGTSTDTDVNRLGDDGGGNGLTFDAGFEPDYAIKLSVGADDVLVDFVDLGTGAAMSLGNFPPGGVGNFEQGVSAALDNGNAGGVGAGNGVDSGAGAITGIEIRSPLSLIGNPTGAVSVCAFITNPGVDVLANQVLGGLGGVANPGEPRDVDFKTFTNNQFVTLSGTGATGFQYELVDAFPGVTFTSPLGFVVAPGETNRLFVVEKGGKVGVIPDLSNPTRETFLNLGTILASGEQGLLGMAFHPQYASNGFFYVFYTDNFDSGTGMTRHDIVSRFTVSANDANRADQGSELILIHQLDQASNHNGGDMHFGADGYLYIAVGDEGGGNDAYANSQRIDKDLFAGILRIDVDKLPGNLLPNNLDHSAVTTNYYIPADNPFVGATNFNGLAVVDPSNVRTEFYAVGLRNPWRFSFDPVSGLLYCGDVGQSAREEVDLVEKGGNYGWAFKEGTINGPKIATPGFDGGNAPLVEYRRTTSGGDAKFLGNSITGGRVYRGDNYPELVGHYIFGDYSGGNIWALTHIGTNVTSWVRLTVDAGIAAYGCDPRNGDILVADLTHGIKRLRRATGGGSTILPPTLADTGVFADLESLTPNPGIVPYEINVSFWSDNAHKERWFSVPDTNLTIGFQAEGNWTFPTGTVWIKHFELETTRGVPASRRRLETRLLVQGNNGVNGFTYRWGQSTTNAILVPDDGLDEPVVIDDGGILSTQVWNYPSRAECLQCHTPFAGGPLGFNTPQLNLSVTHGSNTANQIQQFSDAGYFDSPVANPHTWRTLAAATNDEYSLEYRARSYLQANCSQCHVPGFNSADFDARIFTPLSEANLINGLLNNDFGDSANRVVTPGATATSILLTRISAMDGAFRMPPLATSILDTQSIELVTGWINELAGYQTFGEWQIAEFGSTNAPSAHASADPDEDGAKNYQEWLTGNSPTNATEVWGITSQDSAGGRTIGFVQIANRGVDVQWCTNLVLDVWQSLAVPENRPVFPPTNINQLVTDPSTSANQKTYRLRLIEP